MLICGAGPTGLGAAWRLEEQKNQDQRDTEWHLVEAAGGAGGMAASEHQGGFIWDIGGHVLFSHYDYFDKLIDELVDEWNFVKPVRGAWMSDRFVPFPVQRNIHRLPADQRDACLVGLGEVAGATATTSGDTLKDYLQSNFGQGLYQHFLRPLNRKMWATDPSNMNHVWTSARSGSSAQNVPSADYERIKNNIASNKDDPAWDEDTRIKYPLNGGTGSIWKQLADKLPSERQQYSSKIVSIDTTNKAAELQDGSTIQYQNLVSSMPIDTLLASLSDKPDLAKLATEFQPAGVDIVGLGLSGAPPAALQDVCFLYVPEEDLPFWRLTLLSNYSPHVAPQNSWSILCEINSSKDRPKPDGDIVSAAIEGLKKLGFIDDSIEILTKWHRSLTHGYPVPLVNRDSVLELVQTELESAGIYSRGRFGGWIYEESNQDHAFMQGVEAVNTIFEQS